MTRTEIEAVAGPLAEPDDDTRRRPARPPLAAPLRAARPAAPRRARARTGEIYLAFGPGPEGAKSSSVRRATYAKPPPTSFAALREADARGPDRIAVAPIPDEGLGEAINDRLRGRRRAQD